RIFMGDTGSCFTGYLMAILTISATFAGEHLPSHTIFAPLCVLAVPIYDTTSVVILRWSQGRSPFEGDKNHYSHRLVRLGMSQVHAVRTIYLTTFSCGLGAFLLCEVTSSGAVVILSMILAQLLLTANLEFTASHHRNDPPESS
ncbi:MAG: MraY family glycosyltransferase, partial [Planctomycetia bacterium]|nr:MraY family glycosyltransferase [Planctomycetia bacterium]